MELPPEITCHIFEFKQLFELLRFRLVCKEWNRLVNLKLGDQIKENIKMYKNSPDFVELKVLKSGRLNNLPVKARIYKRKFHINVNLLTCTAIL